MRSLVSIVVGLAALLGAAFALTDAFGLQVLESVRTAGTPLPEMPTRQTLGALLLAQLLGCALAGGLAGVLAPPGHKMMHATAVAFLGSLAVGAASVQWRLGPDWFHALWYCCAVLGPPLGAGLLLRKRPEDERPAPA
jgi:hypothetical protein